MRVDRHRQLTFALPPLEIPSSCAQCTSTQKVSESLMPATRRDWVQPGAQLLPAHSDAATLTSHMTTLHAPPSDSALHDSHMQSSFFSTQSSLTGPAKRGGLPMLTPVPTVQDHASAARLGQPHPGITAHSHLKSLTPSECSGQALGEAHGAATTHLTFGHSPTAGSDADFSDSSALAVEHMRSPPPNHYSATPHIDDLSDNFLSPHPTAAPSFALSNDTSSEALPPAREPQRTLGSFSSHGVQQAAYASTSTGVRNAGAAHMASAIPSPRTHLSSGARAHGSRRTPAQRHKPASAASAAYFSRIPSPRGIVTDKEYYYSRLPVHLQPPSSGGSGYGALPRLPQDDASSVPMSRCVLVNAFSQNLACNSMSRTQQLLPTAIVCFITTLHTSCERAASAAPIPSTCYCASAVRPLVQPVALSACSPALHSVGCREGSLAHGAAELADFCFSPASSTSAVPASTSAASCALDADDSEPILTPADGQQQHIGHTERLTADSDSAMGASNSPEGAAPAADETQSPDAVKSEGASAEAQKQGPSGELEAHATAHVVARQHVSSGNSVVHDATAGKADFGVAASDSPTCVDMGADSTLLIAKSPAASDTEVTQRAPNMKDVDAADGMQLAQDVSGRDRAPKASDDLAASSIGSSARAGTTAAADTNAITGGLSGAVTGGITSSLRRPASATNLTQCLQEHADPSEPLTATLSLPASVKASARARNADAAVRSADTSAPAEASASTEAEGTAEQGPVQTRAHSAGHAEASLRSTYSSAERAGAALPPVGKPPIATTGLSGGDRGVGSVAPEDTHSEGPERCTSQHMLDGDSSMWSLTQPAPKHSASVMAAHPFEERMPEGISGAKTSFSASAVRPGMESPAQVLFQQNLLAAGGTSPVAAEVCNLKILNYLVINNSDYVFTGPSPPSNLFALRHGVLGTSCATDALHCPNVSDRTP